MSQDRETLETQLILEDLEAEVTERQILTNCGIAS